MKTARKPRMTFGAYKERVRRWVYKMLGGKPKFRFKPFLLSLGYDRPYSPKLCARVLIEDALQDELLKAPPPLDPRYV